MAFSTVLKLGVVGVLSLLITSCEEELPTLGEGIVPPVTFSTNTATFDVFAYNRKITAVQANKLPLYQLGNFVDPLYGTRKADIVAQVQLSVENPVFGELSQTKENTADSDDDQNTLPENETVKQVHLYIPYQQSPSASQEEGFDLDSIYGDSTSPFTLTIAESTYFLGDFDPSEFTQAPTYYSDQDFSGFIGEQLFSGDETINPEEILIFQEDDPETEEDESTQVKTQLNPGIRVPLDKAFFQERILDKEGQSELLSQANFKDFFRGVHISIADSQELMLLLDLTEATITITYEYDTYNATGDKVETVQDDFVLNVLVTPGGVLGNTVNTWVDDPFPSEIATALDTDENASQIFVKGGSGTLAEIRLFAEEENDWKSIINQIKAGNWLINEANLVFHVDKETLGDDAVQPPRLYLYNAETDQPLYDTDQEENQSSKPMGLFLTYDGRLEEENGGGAYYKIKITKYINDIIIRDSVNAKLALTLTSHIGIATMQEAKGKDGEIFKIPLMAGISPLGTVLFGSNVEEADTDKKLKLEIHYTEVD